MTSTTIEMELIDDHSTDSTYQIHENSDNSPTPSTSPSNNKTEINSDNSEKQQSVLLKPGDCIMAKEDIPSQSNRFYIICYLLLLFSLPFIFLATYINMIIFHRSSQWLYIQTTKGICYCIFIPLFNWFNGAILRHYFQIKSNYTRKISHFTFFTFPYIVDAIIGELDPVESNMFIFFSFQIWATCCIIPTRRFLNKYIDPKTSKYKYLNFGEYMLLAYERPEDRPNTLLWLQIQYLLLGIILYPLGLWWDTLNKPYLVLIPQIVNGIGDGLAEPIGVKFGKNHQYETTAWFTKAKYVRSYHGSAMVYLSAFAAIICINLLHKEYTLIQFIIALVIVPVIATVTEARSPHTLDNPFITLFVGVAATLILYVPL